MYNKQAASQCQPFLCFKQALQKLIQVVQDRVYIAVKSVLLLQSACSTLQHITKFDISMCIADTYHKHMLKRHKL